MRPIHRMDIDTERRDRPAGGGRALARTAGAFYLVTFVAGTTALVARGPLAAVSGAIAAAAYVGVTVLLYFLFKPVARQLSLVAALVSLAGIGAGATRLLPVNALVFFGVYCGLLAILIVRSTFMPKRLGWLMAFAALGWFTFAVPALARSLYPYNFAPGMIGEGALTIWLLTARRGNAVS